MAKRQLRDLFISVNRPNGKGQTPLQVAIMAGWPDRVRWILQKGADPDDNGHGFLPPPLQLAVERGRFDSLCALLDHKADVNKFYYGKGERSCPLFRAIEIEDFPNGETNRTRIIQKLLQAGAKPAQRIRHNNNRDMTALHLAISEDRLDLLPTLCHHTRTEDVKQARNIKGENLLHFCLNRGEYEALDIIAQHLPELLEQTDFKNSNTPLLKAIRQADAKSALILLDAGANANTDDRHGNSALHYVVAQNKFTPEQKYQLVSHLLDCGADPVTRSIPHGLSVMHQLAFDAKPEDLNLCRLLLEKSPQGKDLLHIRDYKGRTPLHLAATLGWRNVQKRQGKNGDGITGIVQFLIDQGANPATPDFDRKSALDWLEQHKLRHTYMGVILNKACQQTTPQTPTPETTSHNEQKEKTAKPVSFSRPFQP